MTDKTTARRFSPDNGATFYTVDDLPDEYWLIPHWCQIENFMEDRARKATEDYGAMEGFDSFTDCLAYYLQQAESDLILP
jgi:hypothetical protein